jgi:hypothetical protein
MAKRHDIAIGLFPATSLMMAICLIASAFIPHWYLTLIGYCIISSAYLLSIILFIYTMFDLNKEKLND